MYQEWINNNVPKDPNAVMGKCDEYVKDMIKEFPELKEVKGIVWSEKNPDNFGPKPKQYTHWWCTDKDGKIIDPTAEQFCLLPNLQYKEANDIVGKCMNCGCYSNYKPEACSPECLKELGDYYNK